MHPSGGRAAAPAHSARRGGARAQSSSSIAPHSPPLIELRCAALCGRARRRPIVVLKSTYLRKSKIEVSGEKRTIRGRWSRAVVLPRRREAGGGGARRLAGDRRPIRISYARTTAPSLQLLKYSILHTPPNQRTKSASPPSPSTQLIRLSSLARCVAATTAFIKAARVDAFSSSCTPAMVVPPGLVTMSLSAPGCLPVSSTILAEP